MRYLDLTWPAAAENLAADEALLDWAETGGGEASLRCWEPREYFVVVGYGNCVGQEVNVEACRQDGVSVFRRISGGGTVLQGPGCLNYSLVLPATADGPLAGITTTNRYIMQCHAAALTTLLGQPVSVRGFTDLTLGQLKFSGNSQRRHRRFLMFHGTFLLDFDLGQIERLLRFPSRQPDYRQGRAHRDFLTNLNLPALALKTTLRAAWQAEEWLAPIPTAAIAALARDKYSQTDWNYDKGVGQ